MAVYYQVFGVVSAISLICNVMMLIAILSMLQATLTLPGIAAIALTLGMAVDSNVLINERVRERTCLAVLDDSLRPLSVRAMNALLPRFWTRT